MKLDAATYCAVRSRLTDLGFGEDYTWAQSVQEPQTPEALVCEYTWVVINSGMKNTVARKIMDRVWPALTDGIPLCGVGPECGVAKVFGHRGKAAAIESVWRDRAAHLEAFRWADDRIMWCESLPWIGKITKYHLAKNLGVDCAKPDRWLVRLAYAETTTVDDLCARLARETGDRIATVDVVLWRACAVGVLAVRDGRIETHLDAAR